MNAIKNKLKKMTESSTLRAIGLITGANVGSSAIGFLTTVIVLRNTPESILGTLYPLIGMMMLVAQIADFGFSQTYIKLHSQKDDQDNRNTLSKTTLSSKLIFGVFVSAVTLIIAPLISLWLFNNDKFIGEIRLTTVFCFLQMLATFGQSHLQSEQDFKTLAFARSIPQLFKFVTLLYFFLYSELTFNALFYSFMSVPVITLLITVIKIDFKSILSAKLCKNSFTELISLSKWIFMSAVINTALGHTDVMMTRSIAGEGELVKLLGGQKLASVLPIITSSLFTILLPKVSRFKEDYEATQYIKSCVKYLIPLSLLCLTSIPLSNFIIQILLGKSYLSSVPIFNIYVIGFSLSIFLTPLSVIVFNYNGERVLFFMNVVQFFLNVVLNSFSIDSLGASGAALSTLSTKVLALFWIITFIYKKGIFPWQKS